ncbi:MAG: hypothetical protein PUF12_11915 [Thermoflexaceae bacterium]|nr:hypothetical protein [Thermoflexaceae bacterium]
MKRKNQYLVILAAVGVLVLCACTRGNTNEKATQEQTVVSETNYSAFVNLLAEKKESLGEYGVYSVYDMDCDGILEMFIKEGTCEADYLYHVYKLDTDGKAVDMGIFTGSHSKLFGNEDGVGIIALSAVQGYERVAWVSIENSVLTETVIREGDTKGADYYSNSLPLSESYVTDDGLLKKDAQIIGREAQ